MAGQNEVKTYIYRPLGDIETKRGSEQTGASTSTCDGYRALFSGREIFLSDDGASYMIIDSIDGKSATGKYMLAPVDDYFVDRDVWGLTHIVMLDTN